MHILALQPYDAASHRALLSGWQGHSRHTFEALSLPARHFKWRVRQAPIELARQIQALAQQGEPWDALWCTSMLDLAALRGLCPAAAKLPAAVYFHENQLTYPTRHREQRDVHFGLTNTTSALAAIASHPRSGQQPPPCVWWNSAYNRDRFLDALGDLLQSMPDYPMPVAVEAIRAASSVHYPGINPIGAAPKPVKRDGPPLLLWAARWEYDKGPELFFEALDVLVQRGVAFRLSVVGEQFAEAPKCFAKAEERFADRIVRWGYQPTRVAYEDALREADAVVSTSRHEFFGIAVAEAVSAGCAAVLPDALAYPEVWGDAAVYHDQTPGGVADAVKRALTNKSIDRTSCTAERFAWSRLAPQMDNAIEALACSG
ncbi:MAG: DUF3524 domain-containing protein [Phycisphaeraceae bacterium]|nr:DUF3524 domain-containing protein [Phycisphaeraceae bacterium]